ncbi:hypothetical protein ACIQM3_16600 [Streptomyces sp. NPDC091271]|uniref:hypothetical protein n=1 Tax=Streptomyces sp. NPDC091271 TaxID=3365980 RepID=UPI003825DB9D
MQLALRRQLAARLGRVPLMMTPAWLREQAAFDAAMTRIAGSGVEFVQGIAVVKAFGGGERAHREFLDATDEFVATFDRWVRGISPIAAGMQLVLSPPFVMLAVLTGSAAQRRGHGPCRYAAVPAAGARADRTGGGARPRLRRTAGRAPRGRPDQRGAGAAGAPGNAWFKGCDTTKADLVCTMAKP